MTNTRAPSPHPLAALATLVANAQRLLGPGPRVTRGSIVRVIADGTIGEAVHAGPTEVRVIHGDLALGRGPWILLRDQLEVVSDEERLAYFGRCVDRLLAGRAA